MTKRTRRKFSKKYKAEVVTLIRQGSKPIGAVCRDLGLPETAVRRWVKQAKVDLGEGPSGALTTAEREEPSSSSPTRVNFPCVVTHDSWMEEGRQLPVSPTEPTVVVHDLGSLFRVVTHEIACDEVTIPASQ